MHSVREKVVDQNVIRMACEPFELYSTASIALSSAHEQPSRIPMLQEVWLRGSRLESFVD